MRGRQPFWPLFGVGEVKITGRGLEWRLAANGIEVSGWFYGFFCHFEAIFNPSMLEILWMLAMILRI